MTARPVSSWPDIAPGVVRLPSGVRLRGRARSTDPVYDPDFSIALASSTPPSSPWPTTWVRWRDFWLPSDPDELEGALRQAMQRASHERVEITCAGGIGRTGTALACAAVLDGVPAEEAVAFIREHYHPSAVETPWQRAFVRGFGGRAGS